MQSVVIIVDDHPLFRDALQRTMEDVLPGCSFLSVGSLDELQKLLRSLGPVDLILLDLAMPGTSGFSGMMSVRAEFPDSPVIVVSATEDVSTIKKCIELGASGFIPKSSATDFIINSIRNVLDGQICVPAFVDLDAEMDSHESDVIRRLQSLTPQQSRVLLMLGQGLLNKQIAYELGVSEATVKAHVSAVLLKLDVDSRTQAVITMNKIGSSAYTEFPVA